MAAKPDHLVLLPVSNREIIFEEGVEVCPARAYKGRNDSMLNLVYIENVTLLGRERVRPAYVQGGLPH